MTEKRFASIRETAKITGFAEYWLRKKLKESSLPGVYVGKKYLVDTFELITLIKKGDVC